MKRREFITLLGGAASGMAACGARAADGDAGDRIPPQRVTGAVYTLRGRISARLGRSRLH